MWVLWVLCIMWACTVAPWVAAADKEVKAKEQPKAKAEKKQKPATLKLNAPGGSAETAAERRARLQRECKGRPNAGACTGHTD
jgi:hypothetical protein